MKITLDMVEHWVGSDEKLSGIFKLIVDVANGDWKPETLKNDILSTWEGE